MHSASSVEISDRLPVKVEFIETPEKVEELIGKLKELSGSGMIEVQETSIVKPGRAREQQEGYLPHRKVSGKAKLFRIYVDESQEWHEKPLHEALVQALRANEMAGVTVYKSILAYGSSGEVHKKGHRLFPFSSATPNVFTKRAHHIPTSPEFNAILVIDSDNLEGVLIRRAAETD